MSQTERTSIYIDVIAEEDAALGELDLHVIDGDNIETVAPKKEPMTNNPTETFRTFSLAEKKLGLRDVPWATIAYSGVQILSFITNCSVKNLSPAVCINPIYSGEAYFPTWAYWTVGCVGKNKKVELWRYATSAISHYGLVHLVSNNILILLMGSDLEIMHGSINMCYIAFLGHVIGIWIFQVGEYTLNRNRVVVGSSISVYALIGARQNNILINYDSMPLFEKRFRVMLLALTIVNDIIQYFVLYNDLIAYIGHFGGYLGGVFISAFVLKNYHQTDGEKKLMKYSKIMLSTVIIPGGVLCYIAPLKPC